MRIKPKPYHNLSAWLSVAWIIWLIIEIVNGESSDRFILTIGLVAVMLVVQAFGEHLRDLIVYYNEKD